MAVCLGIKHLSRPLLEIPFFSITSLVRFGDTKYKSVPVMHESLDPECALTISVYDAMICFGDEVCIC